MAYYSKYTGAELEERLDKVEEIPQLIAQMITGKDFVTKEDLLCVLRDYAPATYATIPIDNNTIYWENGVLKAATSDGGGQCQWELREHKGVQYLFSRLPVVTQYDVTMYADVNHLDLPSIYDGLPIDGDTIYWEETENGRILKSKYEGSSGVDASEVLSIVSSAGYATQNWVNNQNFISSSLLYTELAKYVKIKDYQEIEGVKNFLNGLQISDIPITKLQEDVLYIDSNVVIRGGLTMYYEDGEIDLPSIKDEIGNAGYDGVIGLASFNSSQFSISNDGTVTIIGGSTGLDTTQLKEYLDSNKYTTETWVKEQGYASASSLSSLQTKVNNFLEGSDTDTIINKWKELEVFLSGLSESDNLADILSTKWTTDNNLINQWNTAYGWGDHSKNDYTTNKYVNDTFVTLKTEQTITGKKNFTTGGLFVNGKQIHYDAINKYWKLEGDLLVTGGVTMYGTDEGELPSILDSLPIASTSSAGIASFDSTYFSVNASGKVTLTSAPSMVSILGSLQDVSPSVSGTTNSDVVLFKSANSSTWTTKPLSEIGGGSSGGGSVSGNYLPLSGGTISGDLTMNNSYGGLRFINTSNNNLGFLGYSGGSAWYLTDNYWTNSYSILHSGNYSSYALPLSGGTLTSSSVPLTINRKNGEYSSIKFTLDGEERGIMGFSNTGDFVISPNRPSNSDYFIGIHSNNIGSYNAGSATKLKTARTIWGQSFDGTSNISGKLTVSGIGGWAIEQKKGDSYVFSLGSGSSSVSAGTENGILQLYQNGSEVVRLYAASGENNWILNNLGIKTSNPSYTLDVNGTFHSNYAMISSNRIDPLHVNNSTSGANHSCMLFYTTGTLRSQFGYAGGGTYMYNYGTSSYIRLSDTKNGDRSIIELSDNIQFSTASMSNTISFSPSYLLIGYSSVANNIPTYIDGTDLYFRYGANWSHVVHFKSDNSVQIPGVLFFGEHNKTSSSATNIGYIGRGSTDNRIIVYGNGDIDMYSKGSRAIKISSTNLLVYGGITMYSDIRKKTKLQDVELSLSQIANAPLIQHYYNSDDNKTTHVGSIAQYWAELNDWFCKFDNEGFYTMEIQNCALASAISIARHLEKYESKTDKKIRMLKKRVQELEDKLERLEGGNYGC